MPRPTPTVTIDGTNVTADIFQGATIRYGRRTVRDQYTPSVITVTVLTDASVLGWTPGVDLSVTCTLPSVPLVTFTRFTGKITDIAVGRILTRITAISDGLGFLSRQRLANWIANPGGDTPTCDTALDAIVMNVFPVPFSWTFIPGYVTLLDSIDLGTGSALQAMQTIASWELNAHLFEGTDSTVYFVPYRNDDTVIWTLSDPSIVSANWESTISMSGLANVCKVDYNTDQTVSFADYYSAGLYGEQATARTMQVDNEADAISGAAAYVTMLGDPYWQVSEFEIDLANASNATTENLLNSQVGTVIDTTAIAPYVNGLPDVSVVEGWTETIGHTWWRVSLNLSDVNQTIAPQAWVDVTPTLAWSSVGAAVTWRSLRTGTL